MDCNEVEIWIDEQNKLTGVSIPANVRRHIATCDRCFSNLKGLKQVYSFVEEQSNQTLSTSKQNDIIAALSQQKVQQTNKLFFATDWFSKVAAILIIGIGVLLGVVFAHKYMVRPNEESLWNDEFSMITENVDSSLFED